MAVWPRPQRLLPPKLLEALDAVQSGEAERALRLVSERDRDDPLAGEVTRLVQGLAAREQDRSGAALRLLRALVRATDPAVALTATLACVELEAEARRFAAAAPRIARARRQAADEASALLLDTTRLRIDLLRHGSVAPEAVNRLRERLRRAHPAAVHASVHLLEAERALHVGELESSRRSERAARPYVSSARNSVLARRHAALDTLLHGMPLGDVEDWARPARPMTRSELAELDSEPWQVWIDCLHMRIRHRTGRRPAAKTLHLASMPEAWPVLEALLGAPGRRLTWTRLQKSLALENEASARALALGLQRELHRDGATGLLRPGAHDCALHPGRFVHLHPAGRRPRTQALLLAHLAAQPGAPARVLRRLVQVPESTLQRHLQALRAQGLVRLAGGGREARYHCI